MPGNNLPRIGVAAMLYMAILASACTRQSDGESLGYLRQKGGIEEGVRSFRQWYGEGDFPRPLNAASMEELFVSRGVNNLRPVLDEHGLDINELDPDEALVLLLSGIRVRQADGEVEWRSLQEVLRSGVPPMKLFHPSEHYVYDLDGDDWPEYAVPDKDGLTFYVDAAGALAEYDRRKAGN